MLVGAIIFIVLLIIVSILILVWPYFKHFRAEKDFFSRENHIVYNLALDKDYYLINKVELLIDKKKIHFDHILFGEKYIYCIGCNFRKGALQGKFADEKWMSYEGNKINHITNPLKLHKARVDYLTSAVNAEGIFMGICVCNDECLINQVFDAPDHIKIMNQKDLRDYIISLEKSDVAPMDSLQLDALVHLIYKMNKENKEKETL